MSSSKLSTKSVGAGMFAAILASLCCITPVFSMLAGIGGIASTFSWLEPFRPYLIAVTIAVLGFAWYQKLKPKTATEIACDCEEDIKLSFWQSKKFLGVVTIFTAIMLSFPSYSKVFYANTNAQNSTVMIDQDDIIIKEIKFNIKGMTCTGCEDHIEHEVAQIDGITKINASFSDGTASVEYIASKINKDEIITVINKTGYTVIDETPLDHTIKHADNISFYKVPLVCSAAPSIGCGSRAKPVLKEFEKSNEVEEAWLNRGGTLIAIVWNEKTDYIARQEIMDHIFSKHKLIATELLANEFNKIYDSFISKKDWLMGSDVDNLSKIEASIIADQIIEPIKNKTSISSADEKKLKEEITDIFYNFFLNYESLEELGDPEVYQDKLKEIVSFGEELLGKGSMPTVSELWNACSSASKSCNHEGCSSSSSCKKPVKS